MQRRAGVGARPKTRLGTPRNQVLCTKPLTHPDTPSAARRQAGRQVGGRRAGRQPGMHRERCDTLPAPPEAGGSAARRPRLLRSFAHAQPKPMRPCPCVTHLTRAARRGGRRGRTSSSDRGAPQTPCRPPWQTCSRGARAGRACFEGRVEAHARAGRRAGGQRRHVAAPLAAPCAHAPEAQPLRLGRVGPVVALELGDWRGLVHHVLPEVFPVVAHAALGADACTHNRERRRDVVPGVPADGRLHSGPAGSAHKCSSPSCTPGRARARACAGLLQSSTRGAAASGAALPPAAWNRRPARGEAHQSGSSRAPWPPPAPAAGRS